MDGFDHILNWKLKAGSHPFPGRNGGQGQHGNGRERCPSGVDPGQGPASRRRGRRRCKIVVEPSGRHNAGR
jgi:hypothetical protein